jgi:hypothetical protein
MSYVIYNDSECHTPPKWSLRFWLFIHLPERQFARAPVSPERQFAKVLVSFARVPVLPERQFCQSASFASFASLLKC